MFFLFTFFFFFFWFLGVVGSKRTIRKEVHSALLIKISSGMGHKYVARMYTLLMPVIN
jgi:hypothetical protein